MAPATDNTICWLGLSSIPGVGRATFRKLAQEFGSPAGVLAAQGSALRAVGGVSEQVARAIASSSWRQAAEDELARAERTGVRIATMDDPLYPDALRRTPDPPLFLYIKGSLLPEDRAAVAIVGTRTPTHYGLTLTHRMAFGLAAAGYAVVSGLARGIDTQAHRGALAAKGRTIAVLACGIDIAYPPENRELMDRIAETGAVVTENPFGTKPESGYFPARNRIISGLAQGTVIVEAARDSGSLITADYAVKQGRRLFAVPGNAGSPTSSGTNSLIKQGAMLVETAADVLCLLDGAQEAETASAQAPPPAPRPALSPDESGIYALLTAEPKHIDAVTAESGNAPGKVSGILLSLELKGLAAQLPGKYFVRAAG